MTGFMHIIVIFVVLVFLVAIAVIIQVHSKENKLIKDKDFLQVFVEKKELMLQNGGFLMKTESYFVLMAVCALSVGCAGYMITENGVLTAALGILGAFLPDVFVRIILKKQARKFNENYAKALEQLASALKAGLSIQLAVTDVAESPFIDDYLKKQFARISSDLQMGRTVQEAFTRFADEVHNTYADDVALSIDIQNETGGHEADVIKDIADGIRERILIEREIKSIFNETVLTIRVIQVLAPFSMLGMMVLLKSYRDIYLSGGLFSILFGILMGLEVAGMVVDNIMVKSARTKK